LDSDLASGWCFFPAAKSITIYIAKAMVEFQGRLFLQPKIKLIPSFLSQACIFKYPFGYSVMINSDCQPDWVGKCLGD
jgi:hypothetical protein